LRPEHQRAQSLIDGAAWQQAEAELTRMTTANAADAQAWHLLGTLHYRRAAYPEAERAFRNRLALAPQNPIAHYSLAITLEKTGRLDEAKLLLRAALELDPGLAEARAHLERIEDLGVAPGVIRGVARKVSLQKRTDVWIRDAVLQILSFRIERTDDPQLPQVFVQMRGTFIDGQLEAGDRVEVRGTPRAGSPLVVSRVDNLDTGVPIEARGAYQPQLMRVVFIAFMAFVTALIAYLMYRAITLH
jgi:tetratricopeptide (TPR) repeat protein